MQVFALITNGSGRLPARNASSGRVLVVVVVAMTALMGTLLAIGAGRPLALAPSASTEVMPNDHEAETPATQLQSDWILPQRFPVVIRKPAGPPRVVTGLLDENGNAVTAACSTCHSTRRPDVSNRIVSDLQEFHGELTLSHGNVSCLSCHNSEDYDALKLADGTRVEFADVMTLCAQCHGQQMKDYEHGVHGGMNGYWDQTRGPRTKNNCVDCHRPHAPQFPRMQPTFKPHDRFLEQSHGVMRTGDH